MQEANRRFFHPLGLALEIIVDEDTGEERLGGIWDYRDDPEGIIFTDSVVETPEFKQRIENIEKELTKKMKSREKIFGFFIQPYI